jgi:iron complex outermembrane recepter protein
MNTGICGRHTFGDRPKRALAIVLVAVAGMSLPGVPANATDSPTEENGGQLQEVVVTATKRKENAIDVPSSISALSGDDLAARHVIDLDDLTRAIPSFSFSSGGTEGLDRLEMRGVSSGTGAAVVAVYLDESTITTATGGWMGQADLIPFDLARIEVLRGPQGTLYGASAMGGAVRYLENQPSLDGDEVDLTGDVSGTDYAGANYGGSIVMNAPLSSNSAVRLGLDYSYDSGWINHYNYLTGDEDASGTNSVNQGVAKLAFLYRLNDTWSLTPSVWVQEVQSHDSSIFYPDLGLYETNKEVREPSKDKLAVSAVHIEGRFDKVTVNAITSYVYRDNERILDGTYFNDGALAEFFLDPNPVFASHQAQNDSIIAHIPSPVNADATQTQITQEVRASSTKPREGELPLNWTVGMYYSYLRGFNGNTEYAPGLNAAFESIYGYPLSSPIVQQALGSTADTFENDQMFIAPSWTTVSEYAGFGEIGYDLSPKLHLSAGTRYDYSTETYFTTAAGFYGIGIPTPFSADSKSSSTTPKFSAVYDVTNDSRVYATIAKGFRVGGGTGPVPSAICGADLSAIGYSSAPNTYRPDSLWSYEVGSKNLMADRTLSVDAASYYIQWKNIQQSIALPTCGFTFTDNFGDAKSYGGELEIAYKPPFIPNLTLGVNGGGGRSVITRSDDPEAAAVGEWTLFVPKWTATGTAEYRHSLSGSVSGFVRVDYEYTGMSYGSFQATDPDYINPAYGVWNGSFGIDMGSFQISMYGKNLANNQTIIQRPNVASVVEGYTLTPLTIGLNVAVQFR